MRLRELVPRRFVERVDQTRADLALLRRRIRGDRLNPLIERPHQKRRHRSPSGRPVRLVRVVQETPGAVSLYLEPLDDEPLEHVAGQFLSFDVRVDGTKLRRAYSLANLPGEPPFVTVKRVEGGRVSNVLNAATEGMRFTVLGPAGNFTFVPREDRAQTYVLIAGGSGITPIFSILQTVLEREPRSNVVLLYGNRSAGETIYGDRLAQLDRRFDRLVIRHVYEDVEGLLDRGNASRMLDELDAPSDAPHFVCGPTPMMDSVRAVLRSRGVNEIHEERFVSPESRTEVAATLPQTCEVVVEGRARAFPVKANQTLLDAGLSVGIPMPFSCAMGGCAACKVRLLEGEVVTDEPNCLSDEEKAEGWVLACCSRPRTACRVEVVE